VPLWRLFKKSTGSPHAAWWRDADAAAEALDAHTVARLRAADAAPAPDVDAERRDEMLEGLEQLLRAAGAPDLPVIGTRHRVIGDETCHFIAPVTIADSPVAGKLFFTPTRVVFAAAGVKAWPWHRVREVVRTDRDLIITVTGSGDALHVRCNGYGDALLARYFASKLLAGKV